MKPSSGVKWIAIVAIIGTGVIHLAEARSAFGDAGYKGVLFVANGAAALGAAIGIYRNRREWGWVLGLLVSTGAMLGYVASRTVGLPGLKPEPENWFEPMGVASLVCEGVFVLLFLVAGRAAGSAKGP